MSEVAVNADYYIVIFFLLPSLSLFHYNENICILCGTIAATECAYSPMFDVICISAKLLIGILKERRNIFKFIKMPIASSAHTTLSMHGPINFCVNHKRLNVF